MIIRIFFIGLLLVNCSSKNENFKPSGESPQEISLQKLRSFTIGANDTTDLKLGNIRPQFSANKNGDLFAFLDEQQLKIFLVKPNGKVIRSIGEMGRGPKEFTRVQGFDLDEENNVVVFDELQNLIKIFQPNGALLNTFSIFEDEKYFVPSKGLIADDSTFYMQIIKAAESTDLTKEKLFAQINYDGKIEQLVGKYDPYLSQDKHHHTAHNFFVGRERDVIITNLVTSPRIQVFNSIADNREAYFGHESPNFKKLKEEITPGLPRRVINERAIEQSYGIGVYATERYILHHFQNLSEEWFQTKDYTEKKDFLVVYDKSSYEFIGELSLPSYLGLVNNEKLYLIEDRNPDNYTIGVYELKEKK